MGLEDKDIGRLEKIVNRSKPYHRNDYLFREGDAFKGIYAVKTGSIKTYVSREDGTDQVLGFHRPEFCSPRAHIFMSYKVMYCLLFHHVICVLPNLI